MEKKVLLTIDRDQLIHRLLELPQLIADANSNIIAIQDKLLWEKATYEQLKNEFAALQAIARLL